LAPALAAPAFMVGEALPGLPPPHGQSRTLGLAMKAVAEALAQAGLPERPGTAWRIGVCLGTTVASQLNSLPFYRGFREQAAPSLAPVLAFLRTNLAEAVADLLGVDGPRLTVVNACSSGADAIGVAAAWLRGGLCDLAIAGGADELNLVPLAGFHALGVMSGEPCAPFDRDRAGLNLGEGAGVMVLETFGHAARRGVVPQLALAGFGAACDAHHLTAPDPDGRGLESAIRAALGQAQVDPGDVAFVNAHGTATRDNDRVESTVLARVFGPEVAFLSTKGYTGHALGAAGGLEAVFTGLALLDGWIPASAGHRHPATDCPVAPVTCPTSLAGRCAMSTSLAFGGNNAALVLVRMDGQAGASGAIRRPCAAPLLAGGVASAAGQDMATLATALAEGRVPTPSLRTLSGEIPPMPCLAVSEALLAGAGVGREARRADRFCRLALAAATDAWQRSLAVAGTVDPARVGLIVATGLGPHVRTFAFLDGILDFGEAGASPTDFSHSVHNAAASYIATRLGLHGPTLTVTDFDFSFARALALAQCWLALGSCDRVLVGAVDELGEVMLGVAARLLARSALPVAGEGAAFVVLDRHADAPMAIDALDAVGGDPPGLVLVDAPFVPEADRLLDVFAAPGGQVDDADALFGNAFNGMAMRTVLGMARLAQPAGTRASDAAADGVAIVSRRPGGGKAVIRISLRDSSPSPPRAGR
jgi:3-oxoacyl-(acyl-carrier-protein) synthase